MKVLEKSGRARPRFFSKAVLVVTILPLWALWLYAYVSLRSLQVELEALPRFYGMHLYKEHVRARLEAAARWMTLFEEPGVQRIEEKTFQGLTEAERKHLGLLFGPEEGLVVVERRGLRILHPSEPPYGKADFLSRSGGRESFLRTLKRMDEEGSGGGYLSMDIPDASYASEKRAWFLALVPAGEDLLFVLPVPEEHLRRSGGILEEAQKRLLEERRRRFVRLTLPVVVLSSVFLWILNRRNGPSDSVRGN